MIACASCGFEAPDDFAFCPKCATRLAAPLSAAEERKTVTTLFCDLVAFTAMSEVADPEDVDALLGEYFARATRVIESHGGTVEKFIGDAVVGVFGVPAVHEDDPERAVRAALRILEALEGITRPDGTSLEARCGVNTGEALVRLDIDPASGRGFLTGDAVNTAARLQAAAPPGGVAVGQLTHQLTERVIVYEVLAPVSAKGKTEPLAVWLALAPVSRVQAPADLALLSPLVGRERELATLRSLFDAAVATTSSRSALLVGEAGIGKTRLVVELYGYVDGSATVTTWRQGRCLPYGDGSAFSALTEIVKAHAGVLETDDRETAATKLAAVVAGDGTQDWILTRLGALVGLDAPEATREENFAAWSAFFTSLAMRGPLVLVFEDLHWADDALLAFLTHLIEHVDKVPLLLVATARQEFLHDHPDLVAGLGVATRLELDPLTVEQSSQLVTALLDDGMSLGRLRDVLTQRVGGNPFYIEESVRLVAEEAERGLQVVGGESDALELDDVCILPGTVQAILAARLDALPVDLKTVLADAAVIGASFWSGAIAAVEARSRDSVEACLRQLQERRLVRAARQSTVAGEREHTFCHALAREVSYRQMPRRVRLEKHVAVARWLEDEAGDRADDQAEAIGRQYLTAYDLALASRADDRLTELGALAGHCLAVSGERALKLDIASAQPRLKRATELLGPGRERGRALRLLARALVLAGRHDEAMREFAAAAQQLEEAGDPNGAADALIDLCMWQAVGGFGDWQSTFREAVALYDFEAPTPELAHALQDSAAVLTLRFFDAAAAEHAADQALEVAERLGMRPPPGAYEWRSEARASLGDVSWVEDYERAVAEGEAQLAGNDLLRLYQNRSHLLESTEGPASAVRAMRANALIAGQLGSDYWALSVGSGLAWGRFALGEWGEAAVEADDLAVTAKRSGWDEATAILQAVRGFLHVARGEPHDGERADELLSDLEAFARPGAADHLLTATSLVAAAGIHAGRGDGGKAATLLERCATERHLGPWGAACEGYRFGVVPWAVALALRLGLEPLARRLATDAGTLTNADRLAATLAAALVMEAEETREDAVRAFAQAAEGWRDFGVPYEAAQALLGQGRCLVALGRAPEAAKPLVRAREIFARLGARPALDETDALLTTTEL